jgi:hypothetical protein
MTGVAWVAFYMGTLLIILGVGVWIMYGRGKGPK